MKENKTFYN